MGSQEHWKFPGMCWLALGKGASGRILGSFLNPLRHYWSLQPRPKGYHLSSHYKSYSFWRHRLKRISLGTAKVWALWSWESDKQQLSYWKIRVLWAFIWWFLKQAAGLIKIITWNLSVREQGLLKTLLLVSLPQSRQYGEETQEKEKAVFI